MWKFRLRATADLDPLKQVKAWRRELHRWDTTSDGAEDPTHKGLFSEVNFWYQKLPLLLERMAVTGFH